MPPIFWTGELSFPLKCMVNTGSIIAWITGNARDTTAMKEKIKNGYNGKYSDYIHQYDALSTSHYVKIATKLVEKLDCSGKEILDAGCGTGILSRMALKKGAAKMACVDVSSFMLEKCREKLAAEGYPETQISYHEIDAEGLPFEDNAYDLVLSNMVLGMIPNPQAMVADLARVLRPGGTLALSGHGPAHYREAIEAGVKSMKMRYYFGHRFEPQQRAHSPQLAAGLASESLYWQNSLR